MNSFNHYAYGAIGEWMYRVMAGVEADESAPGFRHSIYYPRIGGGLDYVNTTYRSIYGENKVQWSVTGECVELKVQIPANTTASIRLDEAKEVFQADGLDFTEKGDYMEAEAGSGSYTVLFKR